MVVDLFAETQLLRGLLWAVLGVSFWIGGIVIAHYFWEHHRGG